MQFFPLDQQAQKLGKVDYLAQGTIYPDVIESVSPNGPSAMWMDHHPQAATARVNRASRGNLSASGAGVFTVCIMPAA